MGLDANFYQEVAYYRNFRDLDRAISNIYLDMCHESGNTPDWEGQEVVITPEIFARLCAAMQDYNGDWKKQWKKDKKRIEKALNKGKTIYYTSSF